LEEPSYATCAGTVADRVRAEDGTNAACDALAKLL
jgi:hypothetical protein